MYKYKTRFLMITLIVLAMAMFFSACSQAEPAAEEAAQDEPAAESEPAEESQEPEAEAEEPAPEEEAEESEAAEPDQEEDEEPAEEEEAAAEEEMAEEEPITLTFWRITGDSAEGEAEKRIWDDNGELYEMWIEEHPNVEIVIESTPFDEYTTRQLTALAAGGGGDVMMVDNLSVAPAAGTGGLEPLDSCIDSQSAMVPDDWIPGLYAVGTIDGTQYSVPFDTDTRILFYNKQILEEAGVEEVPTTWDEYVAAADQIDALEGNVSAMSYSGARFWALSYMWLGPFFNQLDASLLTPDRTGSAVLEEDTVRAFEFGYELAQYSPEAAISYIPPDLHTLFTQGQLAFLIQGPWLDNVIQQETDWEVGNEYDVALVPGPSEGVTGSANGGWHMAIGANSEHKEAACEFLAWVTSPEIMAVATKDHIPTRISAQESEFFQEYIEGKPVIQKSIEQSATGGPPIAPVAEAPEIAQLLHRYFLNAVEGEMTLDEALQELDAEVEAVISQ